MDLDAVSALSFDSNSSGLPARKQWYEPKRPERGYLGLQNQDPGDVVWVKEVRLRPLPAGGAK